LIKNKKILNIFEEIENYFNLISNESVIITNLRLIYAYPSNKAYNLLSINLDSVYYINIFEFDQISSLIIFYFDEDTIKNKISRISNKKEDIKGNDAMIDNIYTYFKNIKKNNFCLKQIKIESRNYKNTYTLRNIYNALLKKCVGKTILNNNNNANTNNNKIIISNY
jgi:hypothetical protein